MANVEPETVATRSNSAKEPTMPESSKKEGASQKGEANKKESKECSNA